MIRGKVGIMMSERFTHVWRENGSIVEVQGRHDISTTRCMAVTIPKSGRQKGMAIIAAYAPVSGQSYNEEKSVDNF